MTYLISPVKESDAGTNTKMPSAGICQPIAEDPFYSTIQLVRLWAVMPDVLPSDNKQCMIKIDGFGFDNIDAPM